MYTSVAWVIGTERWHVKGGYCLSALHWCPCITFTVQSGVYSLSLQRKSKKGRESHGLDNTMLLLQNKTLPYYGA